jgi:hypothetical protein
VAKVDLRKLLRKVQPLTVERRQLDASYFPASAP